jgi:CheY-like chemotaxis protein
MHATDQGEDLLRFAEESPNHGRIMPGMQKPWRILIVDDVEDVHKATVLALRDTVFQGRGVEFLHAYNAQQASSRLHYDRDIALVLLDVVMETQDAGLRLARHLRDDLGDHQVQIVLRTGQPGDLAERDIIIDYEINDYLPKGSLTGTQLFTTVISSLRTYDSLSKSKSQHEVLRATASRVKELESVLEQQGQDSEQAMHEAEQRWLGALDGAGDGAWDVNFESGAVSFSKRWKQSHGYAEDAADMRLAGWKAMIHPDDLQGVLASMRDYLAGTSPSFECSHRSKCEDGSWQWVVDRGVVVKRSAAGKPVRMVGTHTRIDEPN